ncbi:rhodanese-like domain-containing protein [Ignavibacteria bacterium]|nr:rhodanese-like domain-containing protein [Bacteroidota bacterium]MCZ2132829.1 rhodanese-like domain-containing protein [Bacteroidota bacterium]
MFDVIKSLIGMGKSPNFSELVANGAQIIDVRSPGEFQSGHVKGSRNIPLPNLSKELSKISKSTPVITCCASGMRSATAASFLRSNGYNEVYNGGGWMSLQGKLSS